MGLDMSVTKDGEEVIYWRKHANLHGYMDSVHGADNCIDVLLTEEIVEELLILSLLALADQGELSEEKTGFFWGTTTEDQHLFSVKEFVKLLVDMRENPNSEYYYCGNY